ncbi:glycosyltransferase family 2 protein [Pleurocapsa sp. FMAR1]|uniref:glycosyltransferase family 2 protein n=1 Tax=Pleurocapsa sp. FMAR1 TaxID=3040204 RepID=UPI0029C85C19|nr:glycosyltransferase family A protein [Pleurocapsa sp. FMAR1]
MPKVTVIIPAYNAMAFLPEALNSVFNQTYQDFEVIVVNDGSTDETEQWVSQIEDPRVNLVSQENKGLAGARNTGIGHAQGEYIAFLDDDDLWESTKLEKQVNVLDENPEVGLVYTWVSLIDSDGKPRGRIWCNSEEGNVWKKLLEHNIVESGSVAMVRHSCYQSVGLYDCTLPSSYAEDWDMWLRIAAQYHFQVILEPLVYYRDTPSSLSKNWRVTEQSYQIVIEKAFANAPQNLQHLKGRCYSFAYLNVCWKILQTPGENYQRLVQYRHQAVSWHPQIRKSKNYLRLSFAIMLVKLLGLSRYNKLRSLIYTSKDNILQISRQFTTS